MLEQLPIHKNSHEKTATFSGALKPFSIEVIAKLNKRAGFLAKSH
jgi:hypothetical protein